MLASHLVERRPERMETRMSTKPAESVPGSARHLPRFLELREEGGALYLWLVQRMEAEAEADDPGPTATRA